MQKAKFSFIVTGMPNWDAVTNKIQDEEINPAFCKHIVSIPILSEVFFNEIGPDRINSVCNK